MPHVTVEVIPWLTDYVDVKVSGRASWQEEMPTGSTVRDLLFQLHARHPKLAATTYDRDGRELTGHVNLIFNDRLLELAGGLDAVLTEHDRLTLVPAYAGGSC